MDARSCAALSVVILCVGCAGSSAPVTPTPTPNPTPTLTSIASGPCPVAPISGLELHFYQEIACDALERVPMRALTLRWQINPSFHLNPDVDDATLSKIESVLRTDVPRLTAGRLTVAAIERGGPSRAQEGWVTVGFTRNTTDVSCGASPIAAIGGTMTIDLSPRCLCDGSLAPSVIRHELGHVLGYSHTDAPSDLMWGGAWTQCDQPPSARELAAFAYHYRS